MGYKAELGASVKFTDEGVTTQFIEGDKVICCVGDERRYVGTITTIGYWQEGETSEMAICIDTSKSKTSYSSEIIKVADITYICKNPLADTPKVDMTPEETEKNTFVSMLVGMGYDKSKSEVLFDRTKNIMKQYNISFEQATACVVYSLVNQCSIAEPLKDMCGIDIKEIERMLPKLEKAAEFCMGMAMKSYGDLLESIGRFFNGKDE